MCFLVLIFHDSNSSHFYCASRNFWQTWILVQVLMFQTLLGPMVSSPLDVSVKARASEHTTGNYAKGNSSSYPS